MTSGPALTASAVRRLSRLLDQALDMDPDARRRWLDTLPASDEDLRPSLEKALFGAPGVETLDFAERMADAEDAANAVSVAAGEMVGPYRLIRELGSGGTASVWLAERADGLVQRQIALKLPHLGIIDRGLAERIARERNILAGLEHPNIARLYDAGVDAKGRPYLAIEYVDGLSPDQYCQKHSLGMRDRLTLFVGIARAVAYAHARLVVHRDLKPSNVLVTATGEVRLLDFGIARLLQSDLPGKHFQTRIGVRPLTPAYAAPEQFTGGQITVATDVYSLGVILYELLTGRSPYSPSRQTLAAMEEAVLSQEPVPASKVAESSARALRGDLDTILARALQKTPALRYPSVDSMADDVQRHLDGLPITARPAAFWYRAGKFLRRRALPISLGALAVGALITGLGVALWQKNLAQEQRDLARRQRDVSLQRLAMARAASEFATEVITSGIKSGETLTIEQLLERSEKIADETGQQDASVQAVAAELMAVWFMRFNRPDKAAQILTRAIEALPASQAGGQVAELQCQRARARAMLGSDVPALIQEHEDITARIDDAAVKAGCLRTLAYLSSLAGDAPGRLRFALAAMETIESEGSQSPATRAQSMAEVASGYSRVGQFDRALELFARAHEVLEEGGMAHSNLMGVLESEYSVAWSDAGYPANALAHADAAAALQRRQNPDGQESDTVRINRAGYLQTLGRYGEAEPLLTQLASLRSPVASAMASNILAHVHMDQGKVAAAQASLDRSNEIMRQGNLGPGTAASRSYRFATARLAALEGRLDEAERTLSELIADSKNARVRLVRALCLRADVRRELGRITDASADAARALQVARESQGSLPASHPSGLALLTRGKVLLAQDRPADAAPVLDEAARQLRATLGVTHAATLEAEALADRPR
jgi:eukaryotic-like serine/threonine-protein kinase